MVRPVIKLSTRATETEIKTLKLSYDTQNNIHAPLVWERPTANMYNYHYEIDGLYYQPMVSYCIERAAGGRRRVVDIPDRLLSNYDKRSYRLVEKDLDYDDFLVQSYARRMKDVNSKKIHCANEKIQRSKKTTELGLARGSAMMRDKYLNQVQSMWFEKQAREGRFASREEQARRSQSADYEPRQGENKLLSRQRNDSRYGPSYERITFLDSERYNKGEEVDFLAPSGPAPKVEESTKKEMESSSECREEQSSSSYKMVKVVKNGMSAEDAMNEEFFADSMQTGKSKRKNVININRDYLLADNMDEFNKVRLDDLSKKQSLEDPAKISQLYVDTTYTKAMKDVQNRVKKEGNKYLANQTQLDDIKVHYRGRRVDQIGKVERAFVRSTMFDSRQQLPNFDVGYDVI